MTVNTKKAVPKDLIDSLLADYKKPEDLIGENGLLKQLTQLLVELALDVEMSEHLEPQRPLQFLVNAVGDQHLVLP